MGRPRQISPLLALLHPPLQLPRCFQMYYGQKSSRKGCCLFPPSLQIVINPPCPNNSSLPLSFFSIKKKSFSMFVQPREQTLPRPFLFLVRSPSSRKKATPQLVFNKTHQNSNPISFFPPPFPNKKHIIVKYNNKTRNIISRGRRTQKLFSNFLGIVCLSAKPSSAASWVPNSTR